MGEKLRGGALNEKQARTTCEDCVFFDVPPMGLTPPHTVSERGRQNYAAGGRCRHATPVPTDETNSLYHWPLVLRNGSCGKGREDTGQGEADLPHCGECRFFYRPPAGLTPLPTASPAYVQMLQTAGLCHCEPPGGAPNSNAFFWWPIVRGDDWCSSGERGTQVSPPLSRAAF